MAQHRRCRLFAGRVAGRRHDHRLARCAAAAGRASRREAARRTACLNNLRQIGLGLQDYHSVHASFPPGCIEPAFMISNGRQFAWSALLLPYIEQQPLSTAIDFSQPCYAAVNAAPAAIVLPTYMLPEHPQFGVGAGSGGYGLQRPLRRKHPPTSGRMGRRKRDDGLRPGLPHPRRHRRHIKHARSWPRIPAFRCWPATNGSTA